MERKLLYNQSPFSSYLVVQNFKIALNEASENGFIALYEVMNTHLNDLVWFLSEVFARMKHI